MYHYHLARFIAGPSPNGHGNLIELQAALKRVLQAGLAFLPVDGPDEEEGNRPGSPAEAITQLERDDPRAIDFRNNVRTWSVLYGSSLLRVLISRAGSGGSHGLRFVDTKSMPGCTGPSSTLLSLRLRISLFLAEMFSKRSSLSWNIVRVSQFPRAQTLPALHCFSPLIPSGWPGDPLFGTLG